jgi:hypothetical protein
VRQDISISAKGIHHLFFGKYLPEWVENILILASNGIIGGKIMVYDAIDRLSQRTQKEAHVGVERTARIHRWSFDHNGIHPTSMASIQAEECP